MHEIFTGMLVYDGCRVYFRAMLMLFVVLFCCLHADLGHSRSRCRPRRLSAGARRHAGHVPDGFGQSLLMVFLGVEMASVPSYALAGMLKGRRQSSEAALKYAVYGAGTAGVMLYGISLLAGVLGSFHLPTMAVRLGELLAPIGAAAGRRQADGADARRADGDGRPGVQVVGRAVPFLVSRRVRRGHGRSQRLFVGGLEGGGPGPVGPRGRRFGNPARRSRR